MTDRTPYRSTFSSRRTAAIGAAYVVIALAGGVPAMPQAPNGIVGFTPIGDYQIEIDGAVMKSAQIFGAQQARALVLMTSALSAPLMIDLANGSVSGLHMMKVAKRANGSVDLLPNPVAKSYGIYSIDGDRIRFEVDGHQVAIGPKPVLVGQRKAAELVEHDPGYGAKRDIYQTSAGLLEQLRNYPEEVRVRVYFGTWCPFCSEMVPRVLKVEAGLEGSMIKFEYYGLPRSITEDAEARAMNIRGVPTGVVFKGGKEIGRISGNSWRTPEQAILDLIGD
jgi:thiol-disulfide isomerase/thioredoxin